MDKGQLCPEYEMIRWFFQPESADGRFLVRYRLPHPESPVSVVAVIFQRR